LANSLQNSYNGSQKDALFLNFILINNSTFWGTLLVAQLVEALCYKLGGRWFDCQGCQWNF
jgi:hypothetical protein